MITLINPPGTKSFAGLQMHTPNPPLGLAYIAGAVKRSGLEYNVIDGTGESLDSIHSYPGRDDFLTQGLSFDEIISRVPSETDIIGVGCTFSTLWPLTRVMIDILSANFPNAKIILGGEHGTAVYHHVLQNSSVDVVVIGEGEETFLRLVTAIREETPLNEVVGIAFVENDNIVATGLSLRQRTVDDIAEPDWESFPIEEYISRHQINGVNLGRSMPLLATRGCPYQCTFCSNPNMWTRRWIPRNPKLVVDEMIKYIDGLHVTNFDFQDLTAIIKRNWVIDFCNEIIDRDLEITWQMPSGTRAEIFDDEVAELLYKSGCRGLAFAPESGSQETLNAIKKQVNLDKLIDAIRISLDRKLILSCFFVIGFPDDTRKGMRETMSLIRKLALIGVYDVAVTKFVPYPGSELFLRLQSEGKIELDDKFFESPMDFYTMNTPSFCNALSTRRLYWTMIWMFVNFYVISFISRPFRTLKILINSILFGKEETRYAKWFVDRLYTRKLWNKLAKSTTDI
jgi:anaerobic magnesium-protoporphyrin IX monomethyl ester cyclase